jgi:PAS domain S-box-containing protein
LGGGIIHRHMEKRSFPEKKTEEKKFLNALAENFRLQEAILNSTELAIVSSNNEGLITSFNKAAEAMFGYSAEEIIGKTGPFLLVDMQQVIRRSQTLAQELGRPIEPLFEVFVAKAREGKSTREEWTLIRKDGSKFPAMVSVSALRDDEGNIFGFVGIPTDITELKLFDQRARASEEKFKLLAENIPGAIYLCHHEEPYDVIYLNDHIEKITGYPASDFLSGKINIVKLYHPEDVPMINDKVMQALTERRSYQLTYRIKHKSGEWRWVDEAGVGVYTDGELTMLEGYLSDITPQRIAEEELKKIAEENLHVFNNPVNLNVIAGFDGYFKRLNPAWTTVLGWSVEELKGKPYTEFVHPDDLEATHEAASYISLGNNLFAFENRYRCKDGTYRWLLWGSASDMNNRLVYASAIDITERKKSEERLLNSKENLEAIAIKLQEQNRQLDEFAHIISHNLRSPVGNILALIKMLDDNSTLNEYKLIFDKLRKVSNNLSETMNDLMDTLKVKAETNVERIQIRFRDILDKVIQSLEGELIMAEASVTYDFNGAPVIHYTKAYLESIFQNLLTNAIKYRSPDRKAKIHFESKISKGNIELHVSDNGQGIDLDKFGDKLFGLHRTFHSHEHARGVGLFLIKTQIESMGGSISVQSEVNKGSTFIIRFG